MEKSMFSISDLLKEYIIFIPEIQRDYAQGRKTATVEKVRNDLLTDIFKVLKGEKELLVLNYIYGVPNDKKITLIDGQQRVTTLFLLLLYFSVKSEKDLSFIDRLQYATRDSSRDFCKFLEKEATCLKNEGIPSDIIKEHVHFRKKWINDPTVANMLNMLDAINEKNRENPINDLQKYFRNIDNIRFSFISLDGFKKTEELYAAMNSRGKQLTQFEMIKGLLVEKHPDFATIINGEWLPLFWELSKDYADSDMDKEVFASENHDSFLYNYFAFVIQMIWWIKADESENIAKGKNLPSITDMIDNILPDNENFELIKFTIDLVEQDFKKDFKNNGYCFPEIMRFDEKTIPNDKIVVFDGKSSDSTDFFKSCCKGKDFSQAGRCYLWAFIQYKYDVSKNAVINDRKLLDYYLLMRSLFMFRASNETPTSVDKLSLNEELMGDVIKPFCKIVKDEDVGDKYVSQKEAFFSNKINKYKILNNPLVRGVTDNIREICNDHLNENLIWLCESDELSCFKKMASYGFSKFIIEDNSKRRVFIPVRKKMLKSLFSLRGWNKTNDYNKFLEFLRNNVLEEKSDNCFDDCSTWEYYFIKYDSFREGEYGQFEIDDVNDDNVMFNATYIANERATKNKIRNPFLYEVYKNMVSDENNISYFDFVDNNQFSFKRTNNYFEWKYNSNYFPKMESGENIEFVENEDEKTTTAKINDNNDCIEFFLDIIRDYEKSL